MEQPGPHRGIPPENRVTMAVAAVSVPAAIVALVVLNGDVRVIAASVLLGLAGIALVSLAFLLVGQSEDADRRRHPRG